MALIGISGYANSGKDTIGTIIQYLLAKEGKPAIEDVIASPSTNQWWLEESSGWSIEKFAYKLKLIAEILTGIDMDKFEDQEFKKTNLGPEWESYGIVRKGGHRQLDITANPHSKDSIWLKDTENIEVTNVMTVRDLLQKLGTDAMRMGLHPNTWVNALFANYKPITDNKCITCGHEWATLEPGDFCTNCASIDIRSTLRHNSPNWIITDTRFPNEAEAIKAKGGIIIRVNRPGYAPINAHPSEVGLDAWDFDYRIVNNSDIFDLKNAVENVLKHAKILK